MKTISINKEEIFLDKDIPLYEKYAKDHLVSDLSLSHFMGLGKILVFNETKNFISFILDINVNEETKIALDSVNSESICFIYASMGDSFVNISNSEKYYKVETHRPIIVKSDNESQVRLQVQPQSNLLVNVIIARSTFITGMRPYFREEINGEDTTFADMLKRNSFVYSSGENMRILELLREENENAIKNDMSSYLYKMGRQYKVFAYFLEQLSNDLRRTDNTSGLRITELKTISQIAKQIREYPEVAYSIEKLCRETGMAPAKIQTGFKYLYKKTVSNYIRFYRLQKAEFLIKTSDLTISQIVYSVGLTSRSYFCKIFKSKFGVSPRAYRVNLKNVALLD